MIRFSARDRGRDVELEYDGEDGVVMAYIGSAKVIAAQFATVDPAIFEPAGKRLVANLFWIHSPRPGGGTRMMEAFLRYVDRHRVALTALHAIPSKPWMRAPRLVRFYERFGFRDVGGGWMVRMKPALRRSVAAKKAGVSRFRAAASAKLRAR